MGTIFFSYAHEDKSRIDRIYLLAKEAELEPWMDNPPKPFELSGIMPGHPDWQTAISQQLQRAAVVLAFLSRASVSKEGNVQREFRYALDLTMERPAGTIWFIPVLLEPCEVPNLQVGTQNLRQFQWFSLFESTVDTLLGFLKELLARKEASDKPLVSSDLERVTMASRIKQLERELWQSKKELEAKTIQKNRLQQRALYDMGKRRGY
jgi:TIR domain